MRTVLLFIFFLFLSVFLSAQGTWTATSAPVVNDRYDDIYFLNKDTGWAITLYQSGFQPGQVLRTYNGGTTWQTIYNSTSQYRDVGFLDIQTGFIGTLNPDIGGGDTVCMYKTTDGGTVWQPVTNLPGPKMAGICGMRVINDSTLYATGRFMGPPGFYKTTDKGLSWTYKDMSAYARGLVDVFFFSPDTGIAVGTLGNFNSSFLFDSCGVVLLTTDGGNTWEQKKRTSRKNEICWKISFPSRNTGYVSIETNSGLSNYPQYLLKTTDGGSNWQEIHYCNDGNLEAQGIGFINDSVGWIGGRNWAGSPAIWAYQTNNGGNSWVPCPFGQNPNRFRFLSDTLGYVSGTKIYKLHYSSCQSATTSTDLTFCQGDTLHVGNLNITQSFLSNTVLQNINGCDSVVYVHANMLPTTYSGFAMQICSGTSFSFAGQNCTSSGTYNRIFNSVDGCDSSVNLYLTVASTLHSALSVKLCFGDSFYYKGHAYSHGSNFNDTMTAVGGCDSVISFSVLNATWPAYTMPIRNETICQGGSYNFNGQQLAQDGFYSDTLQTIHGCDSVLRLSLSVDSLPIITIGNFTDTICMNASPFMLTGGLPSGGIYSGSGVSNGFFYPDVAGIGTKTIFYTYSHISCSGVDSTQIEVLICSGINEENMLSSLSIRPNPATDQLFIEYNGIAVTEINIYNITGSLVKAVKSPIITYHLSIASLANGVYIAEIKTKDTVIKRRWVKM